MTGKNWLQSVATGRTIKATEIDINRKVSQKIIMVPKQGRQVVYGLYKRRQWQRRQSDGANTIMDSEQDRERLLHRQRHLQGRAKIGLSNLVFKDETVRGGRRLNSKNIYRLVRVFK